MKTHKKNIAKQFSEEHCEKINCQSQMHEMLHSEGDRQKSNETISSAICESLSCQLVFKFAILFFIILFLIIFQLFSALVVCFFFLHTHTYPLKLFYWTCQQSGLLRGSLEHYAA